MAIESVADCARAFLASYDEFMPEYPYAISEHFQALCEAINATGDQSEAAVPVSHKVRPEYLYIETIDSGQFGISESIAEDHAVEFEEFQQGKLRCFRFESGRFEELVAGTCWQQVNGWYRT